MPEHEKYLALEQENHRLKRALTELSVLNDLARTIGGLLDSSELVQVIVDKSMRAVNAQQGVINLIDVSQKRSMKTLVRAARSDDEGTPMRVQENLMGWMQINKQPLMLNAPATDKRFSGVKWPPSLVNLLCVPLLVKGELIGMLTVFNQREREAFTADNLRLLSIIASQSAQVIENARLYEEEKAFARVQHELNVAREIQAELLPKEAPGIPGYELAGTSVAAQQVGGDYFDFIKTGNGRLVFSQGDVCGKGMPAALQMAHLQATVRSQAYAVEDIGAAAENINTVLLNNTRKTTFISLFYGDLNPDAHVVRFINAGHNPPVLFSKAGGAEFLEHKHGLAMAVKSDVNYPINAVELKKGQGLLVFSDGASEAMDPDYVEYGEDRLLKMVVKAAGKGASAIIDALAGDIAKHRGAKPPNDDTTLMVIYRKA